MSEGDSFAEGRCDFLVRTKKATKRIILWLPVFLFITIMIYVYYFFVVSFSGANRIAYLLFNCV